MNKHFRRKCLAFITCDSLQWQIYRKATKEVRFWCQKGKANGLLPKEGDAEKNSTKIAWQKEKLLAQKSLTSYVSAPNSKNDPQTKKSIHLKHIKANKTKEKKKLSSSIYIPKNKKSLKMTFSNTKWLIRFSRIQHLQQWNKKKSFSPLSKSILSQKNPLQISKNAFQMK